VELNFEWDPEKARSNRSKHGVRFEEAASIFRDPSMLTVYDAGHSQNEDRWISMGISERGRLLVVCHTFAEETPAAATVRIFSSRKATQTETSQYQE
jgi:hypothetical protein